MALVGIREKQTISQATLLSSMRAFMREYMRPNMKGHFEIQNILYLFASHHLLSKLRKAAMRGNGSLDWQKISQTRICFHSSLHSNSSFLPEKFSLSFFLFLLFFELRQSCTDSFGRRHIHLKL